MTTINRANVNAFVSAARSYSKAEKALGVSNLALFLNLFPVWDGAQEEDAAAGQSAFMEAAREAFKLDLSDKVFNRLFGTYTDAKGKVHNRTERSNKKDAAANKLGIGKDAWSEYNTMGARAGYLAEIRKAMFKDADYRSDVESFVAAHESALNEDGSYDERKLSRIVVKDGKDTITVNGLQKRASEINNRTDLSDAEKLRKLMDTARAFAVKHDLSDEFLAILAQYAKNGAKSGK